MLLAVLIIGNRVENRDFERIQHSLQAIYNERVIAQEIIYDLSSAFHKSHLQYSKDSSMASIVLDFNQMNTQIDMLIGKYSSSFITEEEKTELRRFEENYGLLKTKMDAPVKGDHEIENLFGNISDNLDNLIDIQLIESKLLVKEGQKSLNSNRVLSFTEILLCILVGIIFLVLLFYPKL
jgi:hypothetical protein